MNCKQKPENRKSLQKVLLEGYESVRPLTEVERQSIQVFSELRIIWDIGDYGRDRITEKRIVRYSLIL